MSSSLLTPKASRLDFSLYALRGVAFYLHHYMISVVWLNSPYVAYFLLYTILKVAAIDQSLSIIFILSVLFQTITPWRKSNLLKKLVELGIRTPLAGFPKELGHFYTTISALHSTVDFA
jgi:hypothetical protein